MSYSWYSYGGYRTQYYGDPRKVALAGCGIYSVFFGVFLLFGGLIMTITGFTMAAETRPKWTEDPFFNRHSGEITEPGAFLKIVGPIMLSIGLIVLIIGIIFLWRLRSGLRQPNQAVSGGPGANIGQHTQSPGQFYPTQIGHPTQAPYPVQPPLPYHGQGSAPYYPSAPPPSYNVAAEQYSQPQGQYFQPQGQYPQPQGQYSQPTMTQQTYSFVEK